jgi:hypothetical protein
MMKTGQLFSSYDRSDSEFVLKLVNYSCPTLLLPDLSSSPPILGAHRRLLETRGDVQANERVFVSYKREDELRVGRLARALEDTEVAGNWVGSAGTKG